MGRSDTPAAARRFEDAYRRIGARVGSGSLDPADARWFVLAREVTARRAHAQWLEQGAPRRRSSDRPT